MSHPDSIVGISVEPINNSRVEKFLKVFSPGLRLPPAHPPWRCRQLINYLTSRADDIVVFFMSTLFRCLRIAQPAEELSLIVMLIWGPFGLSIVV